MGGGGEKKNIIGIIMEVFPKRCCKVYRGGPYGAIPIKGKRSNRKRREILKSWFWRMRSPHFFKGSLSRLRVVSFRRDGIRFSRIGKAWRSISRKADAKSFTASSQEKREMLIHK